MTLAFVNSPIDRRSDLRPQGTTIAAMKSDPASRLVRIWGDAVEMRNAHLHLDHDGISDRAVFLGKTNNKIAWFADASDSEPDCVSIRTIMVDGLLPDGEISLLAQARSLVSWHQRHQFCANCGAGTVSIDAGTRRKCESCGAEHFPRTDPVVIMAVRKNDMHLLGRQASWPPNMFSALAGFMEPGETIEQAVRREVLEETQITVSDVSYVASQPWPFPANLMIGMIAEATSDAIKIDPDELETAKWFSRDELVHMLEGTHHDGLWASRPQAIAHTVLTAALKR
jgi:NAD+ diphosphatase